MTTQAPQRKFKKLLKKLDDRIAKVNHDLIALGWYGSYLKQARMLHGQHNFYDTMLRTYEEQKQQFLQDFILKYETS